MIFNATTSFVHFSILIFVFCLSGPSNSNVIRNSDTNASTELPILHSLFGDDAFVLDDIWKSSMKITDLKTHEERMALIFDNQKRFEQLQQKWDEEERTRQRNYEEREREIERTRLEHHYIDAQERPRKPLTETEVPWYQKLFDVTLPGQVYALYSYLKSLN